MTEYYSGDVQVNSSDLEEIKKYMKQIAVSSTESLGRLDNLTPAAIARYQADTDDYINSVLSTVYRTPLVKSGSLWPPPITRIAQKLTAYEIVAAEFSEIEPNLSQIAINKKAEVEAELAQLVDGIAAGSRRLTGQYLMARNNYVRAEPAPRPIPTAAPTSGGDGV